MQEERKVVRFIVKVVITIFVIILVIQSLILITIKSNPETNLKLIMYNKEAAYTIYNEGLKSYINRYNKVTIKSPESKDMNIAFNHGVKYVIYPDLLELECKHNDNKMKYDGTFKFYNYNSFCSNYYVEILVDSEHINDISHYEYREVYDLKAMLKTNIIYTGRITLGVGAIFVLIVLIKSMKGLINNWFEENETCDEMEGEESYYYDEDEEDDT